MNLLELLLKPPLHYPLKQHLHFCLAPCLHVVQNIPYCVNYATKLNTFLWKHCQYKLHYTWTIFLIIWSQTCLELKEVAIFLLTSVQIAG